MKRILTALILTLTVLILTLTLNACMKEEEDGDDCNTECDIPTGPTEGILYDLSSDGTYAEVIAYNGTSKRVIIASEFNGVPVKTIYDEAFRGIDITSVIIPDSVTSIGDSAFMYCSLTSVTIPDSVTIIGDSAFLGCRDLASVIVGNGVTSIGYGVFYDCYSLASAIIPDSVTSIGDYAFYGCLLTSVTIPDSVTSIGDCAFNCCPLTSVTIPDSVTSIGQDAFENCDSELYTEYEYGRYVGDAENPYAILIGLTNKNLSTYTINERTTFIASGAFRGCSRLANINIPDSVKSIGSHAFYNCDCLTSVTIPDSVTNIGDYAFYFPLTSIYITDLAAWCNISFANSSANPLNHAEEFYLNGELVTELVIPDGVIIIGDFAFYDCDFLTSVTIPDSVTSIGDEAFSNCSKLTSVTIGNGARILGDSAFEFCSGLTGVCITDLAAWCNISFASVTANPLYYAKNLYLNGELVMELVIPDGVTSIGSYAFYDCDWLTSVTIPDSVTSIGEDAFYSCSNLTSVYITDLAAWCNISFANTSANPLDCAKRLYLNGGLLVWYSIPDGVTRIGDYAFYNCYALASVIIPDSVTSIGNYAFYKCPYLKIIYYCGTEEEWAAIEKGQEWIETDYTVTYNYS